MSETEVVDKEKTRERKSSRSPGSSLLSPVQWGPASAILVGFGAFFGAQILFSILLIVLISLIGQDPVEFIDQHETSVLLNMAASVSVAGTMIAVVYAYVRKRGSWAALGLKRPKLRQFGYVFPAYAMYFVALIAILFLVSVLYPAFDLEQEQIVGFEDAADAAELAAAFVSLVILAPLAEEILFRGFVFQGLAKIMTWFSAAFITSLAFGLAHGQVNVGIDTFVLGMVAAWLFIKTGNLWPAIALHAIKNGIAFIVLFVVGA